MQTSEPDGNGGRIAILAGSGRLPQILADRLDRSAQPPFVIDLVGELGRWKPHHQAQFVPPTCPGRAYELLRAHGIGTVTMAGGISVRPRLSQFRFDRVFLKYLVPLVFALMRGDDGLLSAVVGFFEKDGFEVRGAHEIDPALLVSESVMTRIQPSADDHLDIVCAMQAARQLGARDRGQAAVARKNGILALEDHRGTAHMLSSIAEAEGAQSLRKSGVLAKVSKPDQELRVDMPAIGTDTVLQAKRAGLAGIVVEAGHTLIIDREETIRQANALGLFLLGRRMPDGS